MSESNVSNSSGGSAPVPVSSLGPHYGSGLTSSAPSSGLGHLTTLSDTLGFGLGLFSDPDPTTKSSLPPFSSFGDPEGANDSLSGRFLDLGLPSGSSNNGWDLYGEGLSARLIDVGGPTTFGLGIGVGLGIGINPPAPTAVPASVAVSVGNSQIGSQYRPWETKSMLENGTPTILELGRMNPHPHAFQDPFALQNPGPKLPSFQSQFHTFPANPPHPPGPPATDGHFHATPAMIPQRYPLVPTPIQPRPPPEVLGGQQFPPQDDRHHLASFAHADSFPGMSVSNRPPGGNGHAVSSTMKHEADNSRSPFVRKKEKRKYRTLSADNGCDPDDSSPTNLPVISSTTPADPTHRGPGFKHPGQMSGQDPASGQLLSGEKQTKKKRKRCGECIGCMRKDNCGSCAPCRNDKSHQICKMRRCDKLTEKKVKVPRGEKETRGRAGAAAATAGAGTGPGTGTGAPQPVAPAPGPTPAPSHSPSTNWDSYTPNSNWQPNGGAPGGPVVSAPSVEQQPPWAGFQSQSHEEPRFSDFAEQGYVLSHSFQAPAPVANTSDPFRPRPSPQPGMMSPAPGLHGSFSPHPRVSPHPSPGGGSVNGRCSVPPISQAQQNFMESGGSYSNGGSFGSPIPRPPSSNPAYDNGGSNEKGLRGTEAHPNGQPGYSALPHQSSLSSRGYPGHQSSVQSGGDLSRSSPRDQLPHEELNNRLKEKILYKQQQQQYQEQLDYYQQQQQYFNCQSLDGSQSLNDGSGASVRLDVHVEDQGRSEANAELKTTAAAAATSLPQMISQNQQNHHPDGDYANPQNPGSCVSLSPSWNDSSATNSSDALINLQNNIKDQNRPPLQAFPAGP